MRKTIYVAHPGILTNIDKEMIQSSEFSSYLNMVIDESKKGLMLKWIMNNINKENLSKLY